MRENPGFTQIIEGCRLAEEGSADALRLERMFDDNTREWASLLIDIHIEEYNLHPETRATLWEVVKQANREILLQIEIEITYLANFVDFYAAYIHQSLLESYFHSLPRLAEIVRKNVKHKLIEESVLPALDSGDLKNIAGRKVQRRSINPPVFDAWKNVKDDNYPQTMEQLCRPLFEDVSSEDCGGGSLLGEKQDLRTRHMLWSEVEEELEEIIDTNWNYDRVPFSKPGEETRNFFRTTLNWFLLNDLMQSDQSADKVDRMIDDLEKKERYNLKIGATDSEVVSALFESFRAHGPNEFYRKFNAEIGGKNLGLIFDRIANGIYNRVLFPELAKFTASDWGIERQ